MKLNRNTDYFLVVAREGSFSKAAEKLFVSQSYLSQYIIRLEKELNVKLFDRKQTPIVLTEAGLIFRNYLESSNYLFQKMCSDLNTLTDEQEQILRLGIGTWRGSILLPNILPVFFEKYPNARLNLHEFPVSELIPLLMDNVIDFAVMNTAIDNVDTDLLVETLTHERILIVLNRTMANAERFIELYQSGKTPDLKSLINMRFISLELNLTVGKHVNNYLERNLIDFPNRIFTTNNATALALVEQGLGFCFMVESGITEIEKRPSLVALDLHSLDLMIPLSVVRKKKSFLSPLSRSCIEMIRYYYEEVIGKNLTI